MGKFVLLNWIMAKFALWTGIMARFVHNQDAPDSNHTNWNNYSQEESTEGSIEHTYTGYTRKLGELTC